MNTCICACSHVGMQLMAFLGVASAVCHNIFGMRMTVVCCIVLTWQIYHVELHDLSQSSHKHNFKGHAVPIGIFIF